MSEERLGESVREMLNRRSTEKALGSLGLGQAKPGEEAYKEATERQAFWKSVRKRRRRPWK